MVEGSKARSKRNEVRARRRTQKSFSILGTMFNVSELYDIHSFLPDLKYRPPFLLSLLVPWLVRSCYLI
jgi:hypothetical protein